jgi:hypothetical protein
MNFSSVAIFLFWTAIGCITAYMAKQKNRNPVIWFFVGLFFSLFGFLLLLALPNKEKTEEEKENVKIPDIKSMQSESTAFSDDSLYSEPRMPRVSRDPSLDWYFVDENNQILGPMKLKELRKSLIEKNAGLKTYIWCEEYLDWMQISDLQNGGNLLDKDFL